MFANFHMKRFDTKDEREAAAALTITERQTLIEQMLVATPTFMKTVSFLQRQHMPVPGGRHGRGRVCGILGPSRVGKSWAAKAYCASLGYVDSDHAIMPKAIYIDCKKKWSPLVFAQALADKAEVGRRGRASAAAILELVAADLCENQAELLVIDDAHWMFTNGEAADVVKGFLIGLAEAKVCNIILIGTEPISLIVRSEEHLYGRGLFPTVRLAASEWQNGKDPGEFHLALGEIDDMLPFREPSKLMAPTTAAHLYHLSAGKLGLAMNYIVDAANIAMSEDADRITLSHFQEAAEDRRLPGDEWMPFMSRVDLGRPGISRSVWDKEDEEAAKLIQDRLEAQNVPTLHKRGRAGKSARRGA